MQLQNVCRLLAQVMVAPLAVALLAMQLVAADYAVTDDAGRQLMLARPAARIVTLAPYLAELVFAVGGGERLVGVSAASDYPPAVSGIDVVGGLGGLDVERILQLQPDLVLAWQSGNPQAVLERLEQAGVPVYLSEPRSLDDVATSMQRIGLLTGTPQHAAQAVADYATRLAALRERYAHRPVVEVFYQVWDEPLMTVNGEHLVSAVLAACGGRNLFADQAMLVPRINKEAVLAGDPAVLLAAADGPAGAQALAGWRRWPQLTAVRQDHLYTVPGDYLVRHTPRVLDGVEAVCEILEGVR